MGSLLALAPLLADEQKHVLLDLIGSGLEDERQAVRPQSAAEPVREERSAPVATAIQPAPGTDTAVGGATDDDRLFVLRRAGATRMAAGAHPTGAPPPCAACRGRFASAGRR